MTFSIAGLCRRTGMLGAAITTSSIAVGSRCPWARAGVGVVLTQNLTDPRLAPQGLDLLEQGLDAGSVVKRVVAGAENVAHRQLAVIDREGRTAHYTGAKAIGTNAVAEGGDCVAAGNLLANLDVPKAMTASFEANPDLHLAERLLQALAGGVAAGGEVGPVKSAALLVVDRQAWPLVDLRVDRHEAPVSELESLWREYEPQMDAYVTRALDPDQAPSFEVPGDL